MAWLKFDPQTGGGQYLEDLATACWLSDSLFTALDAGLFEFLDRHPSATPADISAALPLDEQCQERFLQLLRALHLVDCYEGRWYNTALADTYLVQDRPLYQGGSIAWRRQLKADWATLPQVLAAGTRTHFPSADTPEADMAARRLDYLRAMDAVIRLKLPDILPLLGDAVPTDRPLRILDVGAGSGGFSRALLEKYPRARATLMDIGPILPHTRQLVSQWPAEMAARVDYLDQNILETPWTVAGDWDLIVLSNIVHAYGEEETAAVLAGACRCLAPQGLMLLHDFFTDHWETKSRLSDINMLVNTYNGRAYASTWIRQKLAQNGLASTGLVPLPSDTALVFASADSAVLDALALDPRRQIIPLIRELGFDGVTPLDPQKVVLGAFAKNKCAYGCDYSGTKPCHANRELPVAAARETLEGYRAALLLQGEPPTGDFQRRCLQAEATAFKHGFYKAFVFWAGPCSICPHCDPDEPCANPKHNRPSMEGAGMDVFATAAAAGEALRPLKAKGEVVKYFGLLLLE